MARKKAVTFTSEEKEQEIRDLQAQLSSVASPIGDWKVAKIYEYILAGEEAPYDIEELHAERQAVRDRINEIEALLKETKDER